MTHLSLGAWLSDLDRDALARIIANRPETRLPRPAATLTELVTRLSRRPALLTALYTAPTPAAQVVEMVAALDEGPAAPVARIATGFGVAPDDADLAAVLDWLADRALAWRDGPTLCVPPVLLDAFPFPHRLGPPLEYAYGALSGRDLHVFADAWQVDAGKPKRDVLGALLAAAEDGGPVRALLAHAPEPVRELLNHVAWQGPAVVENGYPHAVARPEVGWAVHHGLLVREAWDSAVMPAEIAVALRGPGWRPPFDPHPPAVRTAPVADELLRRESAAA
ncbi:hypothetical protein, partial [Luedemannella flava]|uniref:hypothetical protein n=1 Tax=Luedemannella flava TaxID=349316 RepID=UPI0031D0E008